MPRFGGRAGVANGFRSLAYSIVNYQTDDDDLQFNWWWSVAPRGGGEKDLTTTGYGRRGPRDRRNLSVLGAEAVLRWPPPEYTTSAVTVRTLV